MGKIHYKVDYKFVRELADATQALVKSKDRNEWGRLIYEKHGAADRLSEAIFGTCSQWENLCHLFDTFFGREPLNDLTEDDIIAILQVFGIETVKE